jgi:hypothetical protein
MWDTDLSQGAGSMDLAHLDSEEGISDDRF